MPYRIFTKRPKTWILPKKRRSKRSREEGDNKLGTSEAFLQWIWENHHFDPRSLTTLSGKPLQIRDPGIKNASDGPDFKQARIYVDEISWYGDVEIHISSAEWRRHGHADDPNYNSVILHVVTDPQPETVTCENGESPFTLNILPYLPKKALLLLRDFERPAVLPCLGILDSLHPDDILAQFQKSHLEYLEKKSSDFLHLYQPESNPIRAWRKALILSLWDGFGISYNRQPMLECARRLFKQWNGHSRNTGLEIAYGIAGFSDTSSDLKWNYRSVRPANHPKKRIREAVTLSHFILKEPLIHFQTDTVLELWDHWLKMSNLRKTDRIQTLYGTVYLPGLYLMGKLFGKPSLSGTVLSIWNDLKSPVPSSILKHFKDFPKANKDYRHQLGLIHQYQSYCSPRRCSECFILKKAIQS